jgi:hypothetical protein
MYVGASNSGEPMRLAQGIRSKHLKFRSVICERCNTSVTQESDRAFEQFVDLIEQNGSDYQAFRIAFDDPRFRPEGSLYTPLFRYFGKAIGCHLADDGAPIPVHLSRFVRGSTDRNCIWLDMRVDPSYSELLNLVSKEHTSYAAHGGLVIVTKAPKLLPTRAYSTATIGPIQFMFWFTYTLPEVLEMRLRYPDFIDRCAATARKAIEEPISQADLDRLGL